MTYDNCNFVKKGGIICQKDKGTKTIGFEDCNEESQGEVGMKIAVCKSVMSAKCMK